MKLVLLGHTGYVGAWILRYFSEQGHDVQTIRTDVADLSQVRDALKEVHDSVVINATGKTGRPNVDWCEDHRLETAKVNIDGAINVCEVASGQGNYVVQIGSGCIFETKKRGSEETRKRGKEETRKRGNEETGERGNENGESRKIYAYTEEDEPNFFGSYYSQTKAVAEGALKEISNVCVLRIRMPLQGSPNPKNLLDKLLQYDKILSVPNSVTIMEDFMPFLERVIDKRPVGVLNAVNPGVYEHRDLLELYREIVDPSRSFEYIGLEEFEGMTKAKRSNCVLSTKKGEEMGIAMPSVEGNLQRVLESYRKKR
ncbi:MAG: sugar nucleotide-binding protein [Candidatus Gracilibacteria bacterium]|nr:sugar nucleotide-binding protein [bacterium]MDZ4216799.1 sugar nucleotide-binding protein [Candidatus Gracilibacteria bacterium]